MKRILSRFFRWLLIAALLAAIAAPFAPTGTAVGDSVTDATVTVMPSTAAPGQKVIVSGSGFTANARVSLRLEGGGETVVVAGTGAADESSTIPVTSDGRILFAGTIPFDDTVTATPGTKTWTATETTAGGRTASSSAFTIQKRQILLSPSTARPGAAVEVFGTGYGVKTRGSMNSQVTLMLSTNPNAKYGPFPVESNGEFTGSIVVPADADMPRLTVLATDNNGPAADGGTGGFSANQMAEAVLRVATGVVTLTPSMAVPGQEITVTGTGFPARTELSDFRVGGRNLLPSPPPVTNAAGSFTFPVTVPPFCGWGTTSSSSLRPFSCAPGAAPVYARVGDVVGVAGLTDAGPSIALSNESARPGDTITITGTAFSVYANVGTITFGAVPAVPTPGPVTDAVGDFSAEVVVPTLNAGAYTVTVGTGATFTATAPIRILGKDPKPPEQTFQALISRGLLTLAAATPPGGTDFDAYVPNLPGDTLVIVEPGGVLVLTLNEEARISVSGQPAVDVAADTPTFFALGSEVSVEVIEHDS